MDKDSSAQYSGDTTTSNQTGSHGVAHHIVEFGEVDNIIHTKRESSNADTDIVVNDIAKPDLSSRQRLSRLLRRLFRRRHLQQHFIGQTLYRTDAIRKIAKDELFLDLIIVANIAAIGHELRESFKGWLEIEKFILLFAAVYSSWRALVLLWNFWGAYGDLQDKIGVYLTYTALTGIGIGAHAAFTDARGPVAASCFLATLIPSLTNAYLSKKEELLKNEQNIVNQNIFGSAVQIFIALPYFAAIFVGSDRTARILYWIPAVAQVVFQYFSTMFYNFLHRKREGFTRIAVNIELMVEKFEVLTMIVLGESLLAILFEAAALILKPGARIGFLYLSAFGATAIVYSFQTLYVNVDNFIVRGGKHAIRYNRMLGVTWGNIHLLYHMSLIFFATGLGLVLRDITVEPKALNVAKAVQGSKHAVQLGTAALGNVVRAAATKVTKGPQFNTAARWLFSCGWGGALLLSGAISSMHKPSPRDATKPFRLVIRLLLTIGLMVGMPFSGVKAGYYLLVHAIITTVIALMEYLFVQVDHLNYLKPTIVLTPSEIDSEDYTDSSDSDSESGEDQLEKPEDDEGAKTADVERQPSLRALRKRKTRCGRHRLYAISMIDRKRYNECGMQL